MTDRWGRTLVGLAALSGLWILVYWWWEPHGTARITFDDGSPVHLQNLSAPVAPPAAAIAPEPVALPPVVRTSPPASQTPAPQPVTVTPRPAVIPPQFRDYTIRSGDTLASIARRELGSERFAESIARANPLKNTERLRPGRTLRIPLDPTNIQGRPVPQQPPAATAPSPTPSPAPVAQPSAPVPVPPPPVAVTLYTVTPGDTLSKIAKDHYGSSRFVNLIIDANNLANPDDLRVGQTLRLPPAPR